MERGGKDKGVRPVNNGAGGWGAGAWKLPRCLLGRLALLALVGGC